IEADVAGDPGKIPGSRKGVAKGRVLRAARSLQRVGNQPDGVVGQRRESWRRGLKPCEITIAESLSSFGSIFGREMRSEVTIVCGSPGDVEKLRGIPAVRSQKWNVNSQLARLPDAQRGVRVVAWQEDAVRIFLPDHVELGVEVCVSGPIGLFGDYCAAVLEETI